MSDMEQDDELNTMLARNLGPPHAKAAHAESIEPSSGFAASVMERVREEAAATAALSPIQFPWRRALPGLCMAVLAIAVCATLLSCRLGWRDAACFACVRHRSHPRAAYRASWNDCRMDRNRDAPASWLADGRISHCVCAAHLVAWPDERPSEGLTFQITKANAIQQRWPFSLL